MELDKLDAMFIGAGDLFAALWIAWQDRHPEDLQVYMTTHYILRLHGKIWVEQLATF